VDVTLAVYKKERNRLDTEETSRLSQVEKSDGDNRRVTESVSSSMDRSNEINSCAGKTMDKFFNDSCSIKSFTNFHNDDISNVIKSINNNDNECHNSVPNAARMNEKTCARDTSEKDNDTRSIRSATNSHNQNVKCY